MLPAGPVALTCGALAAFAFCVCGALALGPRNSIAGPLGLLGFGPWPDQKSIAGPLGLLGFGPWPDQKLLVSLIFGAGFLGVGLGSGSMVPACGGALGFLGSGTLGSGRGRGNDQGGWASGNFRIGGEGLVCGGWSCSLGPIGFFGVGILPLPISPSFFLGSSIGFRSGRKF